MQDSNLTITVKAVGIPEAEAQLNKLGATMTKLTVNQNGTVSATGKLNKVTDENAAVTNRAADATSRASKAQESYFGHIAKTTVQSALINQLFLQFVDVAGQAIKQVDLMNNFPATMASMGQPTSESAAAFKTLSDYVGKVGGNIGDATSAVTRFTGVTKDVKAAVAIYTGLNNALIAGDSSLEEQRLSAIQFAQAFERGKPDMKEWLSLTQNMSFQLAQVAKEMGFVNATALGESLRSGETSMAEFTTELTKLSTGTGPIAQQALARMNGIQFSFNVLKNTMVQGVAAIVNAFGRSNIISFFQFLTEVIRVLTSWVITLINWLGALANRLSALFGGKPIFKSIQGDAANAADSIGTGADAASDLGDNLKDAKKNAKELNKSLASFDKMNVLADNASKGKNDSAVGGTQFDTAQIGELGKIFGDITPDLQEASKWAKIFAGILAGLAANGLIEKIFGVNPLREFGKGLFKHVITPLGSSVGTAAKTATKSIGTFSGALGRGLFGKGSGGSGILGEAAALGARIGLAVRAGFMASVSGIGTALRVVLLSPIANIGRLMVAGLVAAIAGVATALSVPFAVAAVVVAAGVALIVGIIFLIYKNWDKIWKLIKDVAQNSWDFIVSLWDTLFEVFRRPIQLLWQFWSSIFILIVAIVATALELIFKIIAGTIKLIYDILSSMAIWVFSNVITPIAKFFVDLWQGIINGVVAAWNWIFENVLRPIAAWVFTNVITPIVNYFRGMWDLIAGFASGFASNIKNFLGPIVSWIKVNIVDRIASFFSGLWNGIRDGLSSMINGLRSLFGSVTEVFKTPINGIIDLINKVLSSLNRTVKVPEWVPKLGGSGVNFPMIPRLAKGGIVDKATTAIIGESGAEAIMPLENNTEWIDKLASKLNSQNSSNSDEHIPSKLDNKQQQNTITVNVSGVFATSVAEQRRVADLIAKRINESVNSRKLQGAR